MQLKITLNSKKENKYTHYGHTFTAEYGLQEETAKNLIFEHECFD